MLNILQFALDARNYSTATELCHEQLRNNPEDAGTYRHLGLIHAVSGEYLLAINAAKRACELAPDDAKSWSDLGRVYTLFNELPSAIECFTEAIKIDPRYADGWHNLGTALKKTGKREEAFTALKNALLLDQSRAETYLNLGNLLIETEQFDEALECFERAAKHDPTMAQARSRLADQMSRRGKVKRAENLFRQSLGLDPNHVQGWFGLGRTLEDLGDAEGALGCYLNVLKRRPDHALAMGQYLGLVCGEAASEVLKSAQSAMQNPDVNDEARALIGYGLLKYYDRHKDYAEVARVGQAANAARRQVTGPLDHEGLKTRIDNMIFTYDREFFAQRRRWGVGNDQPVFIVGLPRSGTTLTEQIISAHPLLHGAGELPDLARLAMNGSESCRTEPWRAAIELTEMHSRELASDYLKALRDGMQGRRLRVSDKSPLNFFQLAFAAILFPNARVIHCKRNARDNALSIWMENFNPDQRYATDFYDLAFFTAQYQRLMSHWREVLLLPILEVQYEETVANLENQAQRLINFLGAPWDSRCMDFHRNDRAVQTPSRWQVRQPIYTRSVGRSEAYRPYLKKLFTAFPDDMIAMEIPE